MSPSLLSPASTLNRQANRRCDPAFLADLLSRADARFALFDGLEPLFMLPSAPASDTGRHAAGDGLLSLWFNAAAVLPLALGDCNLLFLGSVTDTTGGFFAAQISADRRQTLNRTHNLAETSGFRDVVSGGRGLPSDMATAGLARSVFAWQADARHCGRCGGTLALTDGGWRAHCAPCQRDVYPRVDPVVIMLVTDGERCVLAHEPRFPEAMYSCIAGYIEPGEDIAHAVIRETAEELGLTIARVDLVTSQPWPFPHSLMIGCIAHVAEGLKTPAITPEPSEIEDARWFSSDEARAMLGRVHPDGLWVPGGQAIAHHLISRFADGLLNVQAPSLRQQPVE